MIIKCNYNFTGNI